MDIKSLDYFLKIANEKSISKVANQLYISKPSSQKARRSLWA